MSEQQGTISSAFVHGVFTNACILLIVLLGYVNVTVGQDGRGWAD